MDVTGVAAVVTGGASGLGRATAVALIEAGAKVALLDRNADLAQKTAKEIGAVAVACDVTSDESAAAAFAAARDANGPARICVNCAGIGPAARVLDRSGQPMPLEKYRQVIDVCLIGTFNTLRLAAADMAALDPVDEEGQRGVIVNTASVAAFEGQVGQAAYASAKAGVVGLTLCAARDLASYGIRVCTIAPGIISTPMLQGLPDDALASLGKQVPFPKRTGQDREYASLAMEIVRNGYLNGETIRLDGAIRMGPR